MKPVITTLTVFVAGMFLTTVALPDDVDDIRASELGHFAAVNSVSP